MTAHLSFQKDGEAEPNQSTLTQKEIPTDLSIFNLLSAYDASWKILA